jgi:D-arabinose 1-dehydrogenase-like Zn-dependent alcohol dehydrogenase
MAMATMRAARFDTGTRVLAVQDVQVPEPGPLEVLVRVEYCGICLSDVHLIDGSLPPPVPRVTPGHEAAGVIEALGSHVAGWAPGDRVVMAGGRPCLKCPACARGRMDDCRAFEIMGFSYDGAWAQYVVVPAFALTPVPDSVPLEQAAILADAVATPYAGLIRRGRLAPGESVGLWGIGGLGVHAVQIARMCGAGLIIAVDPNAAARKRALAVGADHALDPTSSDVPAQIAALTDGAGLDLAVDLVGANAVLAQAAQCAGRRGRILMIGLSMDEIRLGPGLLFGLASQDLLGHLGYIKADLDTLVGLVASGRLDVSGSISGFVPLEDINDGVRRLAEKDGDPIRLVVRPQPA